MEIRKLNHKHSQIHILGSHAVRIGGAYNHFGTGHKSAWYFSYVGMLAAWQKNGPIRMDTMQLTQSSRAQNETIRPVHTFYIHYKCLFDCFAFVELSYHVGHTAADWSGKNGSAGNKEKLFASNWVASIFVENIATNVER